MGPWVLVVQAIDVRHQEQVIGLYHTRRDGTQCIVVSKLDLRDGQRVVLVDNGYDAHTQQLDEGVLRILILRAICNVVARQQHLRNRLSQIAKQLIPQRHELALSNSRQGLYFGKVFWTTRQIHAPQAHANGARGDDDYMVTGSGQAARCLDDEGEDGEEGLVGLFVDNRGRP